MVLTWAMPADPRIASVGSSARSVGDPISKVVYRGLRTTFTSSGLLNGVTYRFVLVAIDRAGNVLQPVVVSATPKAILLAGPKPGARVTEPPLLRWVPGRAGRVLQRPAVPERDEGALGLAQRRPPPARRRVGRTRSHTFTLKPGVYTWYVWPGIGARADVRYGELLGRSSFVVVADAEAERAQRSGRSRAGSIPSHARASRCIVPSARMRCERALDLRDGDGAAAGDGDDVAAAELDPRGDLAEHTAPARDETTDAVRVDDGCIADARLHELKQAIVRRRQDRAHDGRHRGGNRPRPVAATHERR